MLLESFVQDSDSDDNESYQRVIEFIDAEILKRKRAKMVAKVKREFAAKHGVPVKSLKVGA